MAIGAGVFALPAAVATLWWFRPELGGGTYHGVP